MTTNGLVHLGHARQAITFDMIYKYLKLKGYDVLYASNYTDIDDRSILQAKEMEISPLELADERIKVINATWRNLGVAEPDFRPRVTKCIPEIITFVKDLITKGYAYETSDGDVYFDVKKYDGYGRLSNRKIDELIDSVRIENAENKHDNLDFALWKHTNEGEFEQIGFVPQKSLVQINIQIIVFGCCCFQRLDSGFKGFPVCIGHTERIFQKTAFGNIEIGQVFIIYTCNFYLPAG